MCVAMVLLYELLTMIFADAVTPIWVSRDFGGIKPLVTHHWLIQALGGATPTATWGLVGTTLVAAVALGVGLGTRVAALVAGQCCVALFSLHPAAGGGHDRLITNALWLLVLAPSGATLSLDCRIRTGAWRSALPIAAWTRYAAVFQLCVTYGITGIQKLGSSWFPWGDYSAVYYALQTPSWARFNVDTMAVLAARFYPLTQLGTAVSWVWEVSFPVVLLALWFRSTRDRGGRLRSAFNRLDVRWLYALVGLVMHSVLFVTMELGPFSLITTSFYVCLWHPDEWARRVPMLKAPGARTATSG